MLVSADQTATAQAPTPPEVQPAAAKPVPAVIAVEPQQVDWRERFAADAPANTIAVLVLLGMLAALVWAAILFLRGRGFSIVEGKPAWIIPAVCLLGLVVAGYLAYVEATDMSAVCGPIGNCNSVQQSPYARLFGVLSIGSLGLIGYLAMGAAWAIARLGRARAAELAVVSLFLMALLGTLFSIYLTFLEPFVIGATCSWCLTSAVLTTALMLLSAGAAGRILLQVPPAAAALARCTRKPRTTRAR
jgi:uncharacterized membrane protein